MRTTKFILPIDQILNYLDYSSTIPLPQNYLLMNLLFEMISPQVPENSTILEIECSNASFLTYLKRRYPEFIMYGIDIEPVLSTFFNYFSLMDATNLAFANNSFNVVISNRVIDNTYKPFWSSKKQEDALKEIYRITKEGGFLLLYGSLEQSVFSIFEQTNIELTEVITPFNLTDNSLQMRYSYKLFIIKK